jgi:cyclopropane-fatty-acyl-phospholipid synthase
MLQLAIKAIERASIPDSVTRIGVSALVGRTAARLAKTGPGAVRRFAADMDGQALALHTAAANDQHYEVPAAFYELILGPQCKYSCCLYPTATTTLAEAEEHALAETARHAGLRDGQEILELGCGWGSLSLWMARALPNARILAVSNSRSQCTYISNAAQQQGLTNLNVVTADMNSFTTDRRFDRVVSVEMFEHMANWRLLLSGIRSWLRPDGCLFVHVFSHRATPYRFDHRDRSDWIAQHFFTGGVMPSHGLMHEFDDLFAVEEEWQWSGVHYARTAHDWLINLDANREEVMRVLAANYGLDADLWLRRWRLFFLATEGLFGYGGGAHWGVSHYRLRPAS